MEKPLEAPLKVKAVPKVMRKRQQKSPSNKIRSARTVQEELQQKTVVTVVTPVNPRLKKWNGPVDPFGCSWDSLFMMVAAMGGLERLITLSSARSQSRKLVG